MRRSQTLQPIQPLSPLLIPPHETWQALHQIWPMPPELRDTIRSSRRSPLLGVEAKLIGFAIACQAMRSQFELETAVSWVCMYLFMTQIDYDSYPCCLYPHILHLFMLLDPVALAAYRGSLSAIA